MNSVKEKSNLVKLINNALIKHFGVPERFSTLPPPLTMLIGTILSQNTNDKNSFAAFNNLRKTFPKWELILDSDIHKLENSIRVAGLGKQKANAIKNLLVGIKNKNGTITEDFLTGLENDEIISELTSFDGIGLKTASCVLLFSLDRNVCPVDTHVHRTLNRIGLVETKSPDKSFIEINKHIPPKTAHSFHTNLIKLGREICKAQKTFCGACPINNYCNYPFKNGDKDFTVKNQFMLLDNIS